MKTNEIALQSQQLSEQTGARTADALARQSAAWQQMPNIVTGFQQSYARSQQLAFEAQRQHADMLHSASDLAKDELLRKQAAEELQWTQQLHTTDMMAAEKEMRVAQSKLAVAQANKAREALGTDMGYDDFSRLTPDRLASIIVSSGKKFIPGHGGVTVVDATPDEVAQSKKYLKQSKNLQRFSSATDAGLSGYRWDDEEEGWVKMDPQERAEFTQNYQAAHQRNPFGSLGAADDELNLTPQAGAQPQSAAANAAPTLQQRVDKVLSGLSVALPSGMDPNSFRENATVRDTFQSVPFSKLSPKRQAFVRQQLAAWVAQSGLDPSDPDYDKQLKTTMYTFAKSKTAQALFDERPLPGNTYPSGK